MKITNLVETKNCLNNAQLDRKIYFIVTITLKELKSESHPSPYRIVIHF